MVKGRKEEGGGGVINFFWRLGGGERGGERSVRETGGF